MSEQQPARYTVGDFCRRFGKSERQITHAIDAARIEPAFRVGIVRVFDEAAAEQLAATLRRIEGRKAVACA